MDPTTARLESLIQASELPQAVRDDLAKTVAAFCLIHGLTSAEEQRSVIKLVSDVTKIGADYVVGTFEDAIKERA